MKPSKIAREVKKKGYTFVGFDPKILTIDKIKEFHDKVRNLREQLDKKYDVETLKDEYKEQTAFTISISPEDIDEKKRNRNYVTYLSKELEHCNDIILLEMFPVVAEYYIEIFKEYLEKL